MSKEEIKAKAFDEILIVIDDDGGFDEIEDIALKALIKINNTKEDSPLENILEDAEECPEPGYIPEGEMLIDGAGIKFPEPMQVDDPPAKRTNHNSRPSGPDILD
jgi:hypothetical protein